MLNFRYHVVSLAAVFLSLGLGLLVGASLAGGGQLDQEQWTIIDEIETRLADLRAENLRLTGELSKSLERMDYYEGVLTQVGSEWLGERLNARRITLLAHDADAAAVRNLQSFLQSLGAQVTLVSMKGVEHQDPSFADALTTFLLGQELVEPLTSLVASGRMQFEGTLQPADAVVVIQGSPSNLTEQLAAQFTGRESLLVTGAIGGLPDDLKAAAIQPVPHVDTPAGRVGLASMLASGLGGSEE